MHNTSAARAAQSPRLTRTPFRVDSPFTRVVDALREQGHRPVPIAPGTKYPGEYLGRSKGWITMKGWNGYCTTPPTDKEIASWSKWPGANVGVVFHDSFIAIDFDEDVGGCHAEVQALLAELPGVVVQRRGAKGYQQYFRAEGVKTKVYPNPEKRNMLEVLAHGRQGVAAPSVHPDTGREYGYLSYRELTDTSVDELPLVTAEIQAQIEDILKAHGWEGNADNREEQWKAGAASEKRHWLNEAFLANLGAWIGDLERAGGIARKRRYGSGWEAIPVFRPSGRGRPLEKRERNLKISHQYGIKDFGTDEGYSPVELVSVALGLDFVTARGWLIRRVFGGAENWGVKPTQAAAPANDNPAVPPHDVVQALPEYVSADAGRENVGEAAARFFRQTVPDQWDIARKREALFEASMRGDISQDEYNAQAPADLPMMLIQAEAGLGKTSTVLPHVVAAARIGFRIVYAVPEHLLAVEVAKKIRGIDSDVSIMVWEGIERPGMCRRLDEVKALRSIDVGFERRLCRGVDENAEGGSKDFDGLPESRCRYFDQCPYRKQVEAEPQIVIVTHAALKTYPKLKGDWDVVVIDEDFAGDPVKYSERGRSIESLRTTPPKLEWCDGSLKTEPAPEEIVALWHSILDALAWHVPADANFHGRFGARADLLAIHGIKADAARDMVDYLAQQMAVTRDLPDGDVEILAGRAAERQRAMWAHLSIARAVRDVLAQSRGHSGRLWIHSTHGGKVMVHTGTVSRFDGAWIKGKAILYLDATPSPDFVVEAVSGRTIGERIEVHVERSRDMKVVQVVGAGFDKKNILSEGKTPAEDRPGPLYPRMDGFCRGIAAHIPGQTLIVPRARLVRFGEKITALVNGETVEVLDYESGGKMAGRNKWERWQGLIITANTELGPAKVEIAVGILTGDMAGSAPLPDVVGKSHPKPKYPRERILCQTREGKHYVAHRKIMFDPLCAAYDRHVSDKSFKQTMARLRGVNRDGAPGLVVVVADTDLPFAVDHHIGFWHAHNAGAAAFVAASKAFDCGTTLELGDSTRDVPQSMSVVLASAGLIHLATPDRFKSAGTAKKHVQRHPVECPTGWQTVKVIPEGMRSEQKVHYDHTCLALDDVPRTVEQMTGRACRLK